MTAEACSERVAFIITKPLQLMVALNIINQHKSGVMPNLLIIDSFFRSKLIADHLSTNLNEKWNCLYFLSKKQAFKYVKNQNFDIIFSDSDVGLLNYLYFLKLKINKPDLLVYIYEEGFGTYQNDIYPGYKKYLYRFFGIGSNFGGCRFTAGIYLYSRARYEKTFPHCKHKAIEIRSSLFDFISKKRNQLNKIFYFTSIRSPKIKTTGCCLYLTTWCVSCDFLCYLEKKNEDVYIKQHPHMKNPQDYNVGTSVDANVPAELVVLDLLDKYSHITIYDHSSSLRQYIVSSRVTFFNVDEVLSRGKVS